MSDQGEIEPIIEELKGIVNDGDKRLCHKFRTARYYGGIATVDVVGCYLNCGFCWVPEFKRFPDKMKNRLRNFQSLTPEKTSEKLIKIAKRNGLQSVRLSGGEPTLNPEHLLKTIHITTDAGYNYIFETNGLLLDEDLVNRLAEYREKIYVYYSLKGSSPDNFYRLTTRDPKYWKKALEGLALLIENGLVIGINIMADFLDKKELLELIPELKKIDRFAPLAIDIKKTSLFPHVRKRLKERGIKYSAPEINKRGFDLLMKEHYPAIFKSGSQYRIDLGIMNFFDFLKAHNEIEE